MSSLQTDMEPGDRQAEEAEPDVAQTDTNADRAYSEEEYNQAQHNTHSMDESQQGDGIQGNVPNRTVASGALSAHEDEQESQVRPQTEDKETLYDGHLSLRQEQATPDDEFDTSQHDDLITSQRDELITSREDNLSVSTALPDINGSRGSAGRNLDDFKSPVIKSDGGWNKRTRKDPKQPLTSPTKKTDQQVPDKADKPQRAILQSTTRKKKGLVSPPGPYSNTLVMQNGRVPAAKQQSTLFKEVRGRRPVQQVNDATTVNFVSGKQSVKLPSLSARTQFESPARKSQGPRSEHRSPERRVVEAERMMQDKEQSEKANYYTSIHYDKFTRRKTAVTKTAKQKLSKTESHYVRLAKMVARVGSDLLRLAFHNYLERQHPPKRLHQFLAANKRRLKSFASTYTLIRKRWDLMYPGDDENKSNLQNLDSAMIFWFLRYICHLKRPNDFIWKRKPASDDFSETADIARIRDVRNFLINLSSPALYDEEFDRKITELKQVAIRISGDKQGAEFGRVLDDLAADPVRFPERDQYIGLLDQWANETGDRQIEDDGPSKLQMQLAEDRAPSKQAGETIRERKEMTHRFLERHRNPPVYVRTKIFQKALEKMNTHGCVVIRGSTGDGKTTLGISLMVSVFDEDECLLVTSPDQWRHVDHKTVSVVLMDDIFGSGSLDERLLQEWETKFDEIYEACTDTTERKGIRVIITIRHHILEQCQSRLIRYKLFAKERFVDCSSSELLVMEKRAMLSRHLTADNKTLAKSEIEKAAKCHNSRLGYPQCCAVYVVKDAFFIIGSQFFERPVEILFEQLNRMHDGDKYGYLAMAIMMFQKDGILYSRHLQDSQDSSFKDKVLELATLCEVPASDHLNGFILNALENLVGSYINYYTDRTCFTFSHESIMEAMMASFGERHPRDVLEGCSLPFLMDFVGTDSSFEERSDEIFIMKVTKQNYLVLAKVLKHYILNGEVKRISQHRAMRDMQFLPFFFEYLNKLDNLPEVILSQDNNSRDGKRKVGFLYGAIDQEVPNIELVAAILNTGVHARPPSKEEWVENELQGALGMAATRGSYDIYKALIETGLEPPDLLLYEERYLTSVDIVRDLLTRRHWSPEQKDIAMVRAARGLRPESQEIVTLLLQDGAAVNSIRDGTTALCEAVKSGKTKTVQLLLASGASVDDRDATQQTPLHHACDWNNIEVVKLLLKRNADVNARDAIGFTPYLVAAGWGRETILDLLTTKRMDALSLDDQDNSILHICAANGQTRIMKRVMELYPREMETLLIARNRHGWTPLDFALRCGHLGPTKVLIYAILHTHALKTQQRTFVHTRFYVVKLEDFNLMEKYQYRFLDYNLNKTCFQMPRGNWFIQAGTREEYEHVREFSIKFESKLRQCLAKS